MLTVLTGGARSGKSAAAVALAGGPSSVVVYLATAEPRDDEMAARIRRHVDERPAGWTTVEEPRALLDALAAVDGSATVVIDCLALWVTNLLDESDDTVLERADALVAAASTRPGATIVVTNEVGAGVVPDNPLGRRFRDLLGLVNQRFVAASDQAWLCVAGGVVPIRPHAVLDRAGRDG